MNQHPIVENPDNIEKAGLVVGIPSYNEADSIALPTDMASRGLVQHFPGIESVLINVDNFSDDGTKEAFMKTPTRVPKIYISTPKGVKGKGNNLRNLFEACVELRARAVVVVDADLKSITPEWIQYLAEPLLADQDYVVPVYVRYKYDGSITNHIAYPVLRTLFGLRVRQPIGGDVGFSGRLARAFLSEKTWNEQIANFGIDIWMTTIAIARRFNVCQAFLGSPKTHRPKDPGKQLGPMLKQVVSTLFDLLIDFEFLWKYISRSRPSSIYGFGLGITEQPPTVKVDTDILFESFHGGFEKFSKMWQKVIPQPELLELEKLRSHSKEQLYYHSDLWARIVFSFAIAYRNGEIDRERLVESLIPLYHSRVLAFVNHTKHMDTKEAEEYLENISRVFEEEKYYLIKRWDVDQMRIGQHLFGK